MWRDEFLWRGEQPLGGEQQQALVREIWEAVHGRRKSLKRARRRCVFRLGAPAFPDQVIVKAFPLDLFAAFRYQKYALAEFKNYAEARRRGTPAPKCYGYLELRRLGMVRLAAVVVEDLVGWRSLAEHIEGPEARAARRAVVALLAQMFETGVNHIDTTPDNFLLSANVSEARLIDWQYASFPQPRTLAQVLLQTARLLSYAGIAPHSPLGRQWTSDVHQACALPIPLGEFALKVESVMGVRQPYRDRLALNVHIASGASGEERRAASQNSTDP